MTYSFKFPPKAVNFDKMADSLSVTKDVIYVVCTPITTFLAIFALFWWERRNRIQDKKEAERKANEKRKKAEEERKMADAEKIVALISKDYDEVVETFSQLKKRLDDLKKNEINAGSEIFTELDVLRYMCRGENWDKFNRTQQLSAAVAQTSSHQPSTSQQFADFQTSTSQQFADFQTLDHTPYGRKDVLSDLNKIMKFFKNFAFKLSALDRRCPDDIKDEFSGEMFEMGETIRPFVSENRQKLIAKVLKYFEGEGDGQPAPREGGGQPAPRVGDGQPAPREEDGQPAPREGDGQPAPRVDGQATSLQRPATAIQIETREGNEQATSQQRQATTGIQIATQEGDGQAIPQVQAIKVAIPYIEHFMYENGKMKFNLTCIYSSIQTFASKVERKEITLTVDDEQKISGEIEQLWSGLSGSSLHLLRMVMFKLKGAPKTNVTALVKRVKSIGKGQLETDTLKRDLDCIINDMKAFAKNPPAIDRHAKLALEGFRDRLNNLVIFIWKPESEK